MPECSHEYEVRVWDDEELQPALPDTEYAEIESVRLQWREGKREPCRVRVQLVDGEVIWFRPEQYT